MPKIFTLHFLNSNSDHRVGRNIVRSFSDYYSYVGVLPTNRDSKPKERKKAPKKHHARVVLSKIKKRKLKKFRRSRNHQAKKIRQALREVTSVELRSKVDLKKGRIDFSDIEFPAPIEVPKVVRRKLLSKAFKLNPASLEKESKNDSIIKIINIGKEMLGNVWFSYACKTDGTATSRTKR